MTVTLHPLDELAARLERGDPFGADDATAVLAATDLVRIGVLGDGARRRRTGDTVTFGRVATIEQGAVPTSCGEAGEVRIVGAPRSVDEAVGVVKLARSVAGDVPVTAFDLVDLLALAGHDHLRLADLAQVLKSAGLDGIADVPVDRVGPVETAAEIVRAVRHGGLATPRLVVHAAPPSTRLELIRRASELQRDCGGFHAFAPLPRVDPVEEPSTGYDDVKTIAIARLWCSEVDRIQVDWPLYGPKLAQVAITFGANDIDGVSAFDDAALGSRRAPAEDIKRQIRSASATPSERDGLFRSRA
jgi:aminodeoxyfutalosine synthase